VSEIAAVSSSYHLSLLCFITQVGLEGQRVKEKWPV